MPSLAISSMSLGRCTAGHSLDRRLELADKYGFEGVEIFFEDLAHLARTTFTDGPKGQLAAARHIRQKCSDLSLAVICLQPFLNYDGLLDRDEHARRLGELKHWIRLAQQLGTDLVHIPSSMLPADQVTDDIDVLVADLRDAADLAAAADPPVRITYESLAWSSTSDTWEKSWEVVRRVDRPNMGLCLDTFNIAARIYADPTSPSGKLPGGDVAVRESMARLVQTVNPDKVFLVQVVDAERPKKPLLPGHPFHVDGQPPRMSWSRNCRLFYGEEKRGAYLPVREITAAIILGLGYNGWVSMELFNRRMADEDDAVPEELARRGAASWRRLIDDLWGLEEEVLLT